MTTAYAQHAEPGRAFPPTGYMRPVPNTAPAQGPEAVKVLNVVRGFGCGTAARGQSPESAKVLATVRQLQVELAQDVENLRATLDGVGDLSYNHISVGPAFSVRATYKYIGKIKPRQLRFDE